MSIQISYPEKGDHIIVRYNGTTAFATVCAQAGANYRIMLDDEPDTLYYARPSAMVFVDKPNNHRLFGKPLPIKTPVILRAAELVSYKHTPVNKD